MKEINCLGLLCPLPVINTKKYFDSIEVGEATIIVDNQVSRDNVYKYAKGCGYNATILNEEDEFKILISKEKNLKKVHEDENFITIIATDKLGEGDSDLGEILMKGYIYAISESNVLPKKLIFLNAGVKLAVKDSPVLESLKVLENKSVEILSCGTCLDFYGIKDCLEVGSITNMYTIVEAMNEYSKVIKL